MITAFWHVLSLNKLIEIMDSNHQRSVLQSCFAIASQDKWSIYRRLQELEIPCFCVAYQPLTVQVDGPTEAIQVWSVTQQMIQPRSRQILRLQKCWQLQDS